MPNWQGQQVLPASAKIRVFFRFQIRKDNPSRTRNEKSIDSCGGSAANNKLANEVNIRMHFPYKQDNTQCKPAHFRISILSYFRYEV